MSGIYRHVVLFKFKDDATQDQIDTVARAFEAFCAGLDFVKSLEWGVNSSPEGLNEGLTHCFVVSFADASGRDAYLPHPKHVAFCQTYLDPILDRVVVVDFAPVG
ncbi:MAG: Dabb family protein [Ancalomicrobiaceae bacterium]|nr:Dabb family protein [Ancalomicrobiaceae bacterium]